MRFQLTGVFVGWVLRVIPVGSTDFAISLDLLVSVNCVDCDPSSAKTNKVRLRHRETDQALGDTAGQVWQVADSTSMAWKRGSPEAWGGLAEQLADGRRAGRRLYIRTFGHGKER